MAKQSTSLFTSTLIEPATGGGGGGGSGTVLQVDTAGSLTGGPITTTGTISLVNDNLSPGNGYYYGTDAFGVKGFYALPGSITGSPTQVLYFDASTGLITSDSNFYRDSTNNFSTYIRSTDGLTFDCFLQVNNAGTDLMWSNAANTIRYGFHLAVGGLQIYSNASTWYWPTVDGLANHILQTDGAGNLSFVAPYTVPTGADFLIGQTSGRVSNPGFVTANEEVFLGQDAGNGGTANATVFIGFEAGKNATGAANAVAVGRRAGNNTSSNNSIFMGFEAGQNATQSINSLMIGFQAGQGAGTSNEVIAIGYRAGFNDTVTNNVGVDSSILIGRDTNTGGFKNSIAMGKAAVNTRQNQFLVAPSYTNFQFVGLDYLFPSAYGTGGSSYALVDNTGTGNLIWQDLSTIGAALPATYIGYGSASNTLTGDSDFTRQTTGAKAIKMKSDSTFGPYVQLDLDSTTSTQPFKVRATNGITESIVTVQDSLGSGGMGLWYAAVAQPPFVGIELGGFTPTRLLKIYNNNRNWLWPDVDGTANQAMVTDGVGNLSFASFAPAVSGGDFLIGQTSGRISNPVAVSGSEVFLGEGAGSAGASTTDTVYVGKNAGASATTTTGAIGIGKDALNGATGLTEPIAIGIGALANTTLASGAIAIGKDAGSGGGTNTNCILIGNSNSISSNGTNNIVIGNSSTVGAVTNSIVIGNGVPNLSVASNEFVVSPSIQLDAVKMDAKRFQFTNGSSDAALYLDSNTGNKYAVMQADGNANNLQIAALGASHAIQLTDSTFDRGMFFQGSTAGAALPPIKGLGIDFALSAENYTLGNTNTAELNFQVDNVAGLAALRGKYSSSRDDTGTFAPVSVFYPGNTGEIFVAPISSIAAAVLPPLSQYHIYVGDASNLPVDGGPNLIFNDTVSFQSKITNTTTYQSLVDLSSTYGKLSFDNLSGTKTEVTTDVAAAFLTYQDGSNYSAIDCMLGYSSMSCTDNFGTYSAGFNASNIAVAGTFNDITNNVSSQFSLGATNGILIFNGTASTAQFEVQSSLAGMSATDSGTTYQSGVTASNSSVLAAFADITNSVQTQFEANSLKSEISFQNGITLDTTVALLQDRQVTLGMTSGGAGTQIFIDDAATTPEIRNVTDGIYNVQATNADLYLQIDVPNQTVLTGFNSQSHIILDSVGKVMTYNGSTPVHNAVDTVAYGTTYTALSGFEIFDVSGSTGATTIDISDASLITGSRIIIIDGDGISSTSNITIDAGAGNVINGLGGSAQTLVINNDYTSVTIQKMSATRWQVL